MRRWPHQSLKYLPTMIGAKSSLKAKQASVSPTADRGLLSRCRGVVARHLNHHALYCALAPQCDCLITSIWGRSDECAAYRHSRNDYRLEYARPPLKCWSTMAKQSGCHVAVWKSLPEVRASCQKSASSCSYFEYTSEQ